MFVTINDNVFKVKVCNSEKEKAEIKNFFINFNKYPEAKKILEDAGVADFETANNKTYDPVRKFILKYEKLIGKILW